MIKLWKIEARKLAMINQDSGIISTCSFFRRFKKTQVNGLFVYVNLRSKLFSFSKYSAVSRCVIALFAFVSGIFKATTKAQITSSIIKRIAVNMVNLFIRWRVHYLSMHQYQFAFTATLYPSTGSNPSSSITDRRAPFKTRQPFKIFIINQCKIALCQLNFLHTIKKKSALQNAGLVISHSRGGTLDTHALQSAI